jgi:hypothetical protein
VSFMIFSSLLALYNIIARFEDSPQRCSDPQKLCEQMNVILGF